MDKKTILELRDYVLNEIIRFSRIYKNEDTLKTDFSDWNVRDVIGHINNWIKYSKDKLESMKLKQPFDDFSHIDIEEEFNKINWGNVINATKIISEKYKNIVDLINEKGLSNNKFQAFNDVGYVDMEKINRTNYEKYKNESLENVVNETKILLEQYKDMLDLFDEEELLSTKFPTGFSFELWKYMAMDLGIHSIMHILYQYLKRKDYNNFIDGIERSKKYFMEFSNNNIREYNFGALFENKEEKEKCFKELKEKIKNKNNNLVEEIIKINME